MAENKALLPTGMMDQMETRAESESAVCAKMQSVFASFGYRLVNPPLLEFEETLLAEGAGKALSTNTFRLMDPVSQRMMALRSDTTAQIARLAASRLKDRKRPLRICYIADVLRIQSTQLRPERQFRQAGCEFIGASEKGAAEIALIALVALDKAGVRNITIDFTAPELIRLLSASGDAPKILKACERRDRAAFESLGRPGKYLLSLDSLTGAADDFLKKKKAAGLPAALTAMLDRLDKSVRELQKALKAYGLDKNVSITVDPIETRGFDYQSFPCFTLFARDVRGELGRGGAYVSQFGDQSETACGFTLYMDSVMRAVPLAKPVRSILAGETASWHEIRQLQSKGWNVFRCDGAVDGKKAAVFGATHLFKNGQMKEI